MACQKKLWKNCKKSRINNGKKYIFTSLRDTYDPKLDELKGKILFKKKLERAEKTFSETIFPKEIIEFINREINK
jgi:hypothetical protein